MKLIHVPFFGITRQGIAMSEFISKLFLVLTMAWMAGCSATTKDLERELSRELQPGITTLADTLMIFGVPDQVYEDGHIIAYPGLYEKGFINTMLWAPHDPSSGFPSAGTEVFLKFDQHWILTGWELAKPP